MYNVFTDFHHAGLLQSLILLFEKRLGGKVYRPIGTEWHEKGFWKVYDHPATAAQYLGIGAATPDGTPPLNMVDSVGARIGDDGKRFPIYHCHDIDSGLTNKAITFDGFMQHTKIDIVIASLPQHIEPFKRLCELHPNKPKLIYQIGNQWNVPEGLIVKNVMASARLVNRPPDLNYIEYHQEFDLEVFKPIEYEVLGEKWNPLPNIFSFVNCFSIADYMRHDWQLYEDVERLMPNWVFQCLGGQCRDGAAHGNQQVADRMREARFIWHTKSGGDGYGHIIYNAAAVGRPLIVKKDYYAGKLGEELMVDGETCITIDGLSPNQIVEKILRYNDPIAYMKLCENTYKNFKRLVDFDREEQEIRAFLANLI